MGLSLLPALFQLIAPGKIGIVFSVTFVQLLRKHTNIDVVLKDGDLCVTVDLSNANPEPLTMEDLAISRTGSITDAILELTDYDSYWK